MTFFELPPPEEPEEAELAREPDWVGPPRDQLAAIVPLGLRLVESDQALVVLHYARVYRQGFEAVLLAWRRPTEDDAEPRTSWHRRMRVLHDIHSEEFLRFGVEFADGRKASNLDRIHSYAWDDPNPPKTPFLRGHSFPSENGQGLGSDYWIWPLPPAGPLKFVAEWPVFGTGEQTATIDADLIAPSP